MAIQRIAVRTGSQCSAIALDDPRLTDGWWEVERDKAGAWRWTNGDAALPIEGDNVVIEIVVSGTVPYTAAKRHTDAMRATA